MKFLKCIILFYILLSNFAVIANTKISNLVPPVNYFTGREEESEILKSYLDEDGKTVAIVGITGIGKTQLARQYSYNEINRYNIIWFIDSDVDLDQQFLNLAKEINQYICLNSSKCKVIEDIKHIKDNVMSFLNSQKNWLLVFDNITGENSAKISSIIPQTHNGHIIICSQDKSNFDTVLPISIFKRSESEHLVKKINSNFSKEQITELTNMFSDYPILLAKGSIFLLNNKYLTIPEYQKIMEFVDTDSEIQKHIKLSIEKLSSDAKNLLLEIALINNRSFSKNLLAKLHNSNNEELTKTLYTLVRFALIEDKGLDANNTTFEMHDVIKNTILHLNNPQTIKNTISKMCKTLNDIFPEGEVYKHHDLLDMDNTIRGNLEILLHNAETYKVNIYGIMALRESLAFIYTDQLDYPKWGNMKIWLDEKEKNGEINFHAMDQYQKAIYGWYIIYQGMYEVFAVGDAESAKKYLYRALDIAKQIQDVELQFTAYMQLAQMQAHRGDIYNARININHTEKLIQNNHTKFDLSLLYYVSARLLLLEGNYKEALEIVNRSIDYIKYLPQDQFSAPQYLMKARILLNLGNYEEAYKIAKQTYENSKIFFNYDNRLQGRILVLLATAENGLKMHKIALEHVQLAKKVFNDSPDKYNDPLALIVEADIMAANNNYSKAIELYRAVERIFNERYQDNIKVDVMSILYTNIANAALKNNDKFLYKQFTGKHEHIFGISHPRTIELYKKLIE